MKINEFNSQQPGRCLPFMDGTEFLQAFPFQGLEEGLWNLMRERGRKTHIFPRVFPFSVPSNFQQQQQKNETNRSLPTLTNLPTYQKKTRKKKLKDHLGISRSMSYDPSVIVWLFPAPVCPYAKRQQL